MPSGPKGQKRPANAIGAAVKVMRIATSKDEDALPPASGMDLAPVSMGKRGGADRALCAAQRPPRTDARQHQLCRAEKPN